jgi:hypothetical protein
MKTETLTIEIRFDERITDADSVGVAVDTLLETAMSTPDILEEYGNPSIGQTYILDGGRTLHYDDFVLYDAALGFLTHMMALELLPGVTSLATTTPSSLDTKRKWSITIS